VAQVIDRDRVLERIQRLLALSKSSNLNEAGNAARAAQRLMTEHQIDEAQVKFDAGESDAPFADEEIADFGQRTSHWRSIVLDGLASANGTRAYLRSYKLAGVRHSTVRVLGPRAAVATVRYLFDYLIRQVDELVLLHEGASIRWKNAFRLGAAAMLRTRLVEAAEDARRRAARDGNRAGALIRLGLEEQRLKQVIAQLELQSAPIAETSDEQATRMGASAARSIVLESERTLSSESQQLEEGKDDVANTH
jgi:Protein of unknown function (DUF2786)